MKIVDSETKNTVDVCDQNCPDRKCYWPRPDPGIFVQGSGYRNRPGKVEWICGTRAIRGCPDK